MVSAARVAVIGAGPSGIAAAKNCIEFGIDVVVFEKNDRVGGNWVFNAKTGHSSVYENTHIVSSKAWSKYEDFPMPTDYPHYPNHRQLQIYFENYVDNFGVRPRIRFGSTVSSVQPRPDQSWSVEFYDEANRMHREIFSHVMVANGHHWNPKHPRYPGEFTGRYMHAHDFKCVDDSWRGKSVLIIGAGNSACDIAVESARVAERVCLSMRSPQWFIPKFMFGEPGDVFGARAAWLPRWLRDRMTTWVLRFLQGSYGRYGLPIPKGTVFTMHPTANSDLLDFLGPGRITSRPGIRSYDGDHVEFVDARRERFDIVCACTGYWTTFPFLDKSLIDFQHLEKVPLFRKMMHAQYATLYFIGLFQPLGCIWPLADYQAKLACSEIVGRYRRPTDLELAIRHEMTHPHFPFERAQRHATEVDYHTFRSELRAELKNAGIDIGRPPLG